MKEAFTKADNVLATAAKCITDVINSRGHIIVDFADVCTVMKNGGVAILGKAEVEGENRAQRAIEEALNSPLLNDNDIKGAKWILLNINSAEGDFECSMDELETISTILRERTGERSDVIMGSGYDDTLGEKIGITLIATGFEGKDPFKKDDTKKEEVPVEDKEVVTLTTESTEAKATEDNTSSFHFGGNVASNNEDQLVLSLEEETPVQYTFAIDADEEVSAEMINEPIMEDMVEVEDVEYASLTVEAAESMEALNLTPTLVEENAPAFDDSLIVNAFDDSEMVSNVFVETPSFDVEESEELFELNMEAAPAVDFSANFVLSKPTNIYAVGEEAVSESPVAEVAPITEVAPVVEAPVAEVMAPTENFQSSFRVAAEEEPTMQLVMREEEFVHANESARKAAATQNFEMPLDDSEEQRRKVRERIQKLRNLSFNIGNGNDPSAEFDEVPAYVRRNMDLFGNTLASVENYYSKYTVDQDENNQTQISTINTFLDGKKPD
jgi:cell division protein FtsZ